MKKREGQNDWFKPYEKHHNRQLLWHGSRMTNWVGILSQGLRIAPPEAPGEKFLGKFWRCRLTEYSDRIYVWKGCLFCRYCH